MPLVVGDERAWLNQVPIVHLQDQNNVYHTLIARALVFHWLAIVAT